MDNKPRLLDQVRGQIRLRHYSIRTEAVYLDWIRRFIRFHKYRHPQDMGASEAKAFLSDLAVRRDVSASTQNQALSATLFLYKQVLQIELPWLEGVIRAKRSQRLPVVLTREKVASVLAQLDGTLWLVGSLLYGSGMRLMEVLRLRIKDVEFSRLEILIRDGKGQKDRVTMLPSKLVAPLQLHLERVKQLHRQDLLEGYGKANLPPCAGAQVSECSGGVGVAVRVSVDQSFRGPTLWRHLPPSSAREDHPASDP